MKVTSRMRTLLTERVYFNLGELTRDIANETFKVPRDVHLDESEELAARLACWVAGEADLDSADEDDREQIALIADLVACGMLAQHEAELQLKLSLFEDTCDAV